MILHVDQRPKQNHKDENLPTLPQEPYLSGKEFGPMLNQENIQSPIMKCRRNYLLHIQLNDLEELGGTRLLLTNQYNTGIFSCFLLLLPCFSSTCCQTNEDNTGNVSENDLLFSRIQSIHYFLWVDFHDEEDEMYIPFSIRD